MDTPPESRAFTSPLGGVMTRRAGSMTGDLEVWLDGDAARLRYVGAEDVETVEGSVGGRSLDEVVAVLTRDLGSDPDGNPRTTSLTDSSLGDEAASVSPTAEDASTAVPTQTDAPGDSPA